jgi:hypothetical protein
MDPTPALPHDRMAGAITISFIFHDLHRVNAKRGEKMNKYWLLVVAMFALVAMMPDVSATTPLCTHMNFHNYSSYVVTLGTWENSPPLSGIGKAADNNLSTYAKAASAYANLTWGSEYRYSTFALNNLSLPCSGFLNIPTECRLASGIKLQIHSDDTADHMAVYCSNGTDFAVAAFAQIFSCAYNGYENFYEIGPVTDIQCILDECNSSFVGLTTCGGEGNSYILTCANLSIGRSVAYDWNSTVEYCENGCLTGTCIAATAKNCFDKCEPGEQTCDGSAITYCRLGTDGCYHYDPANESACVFGCRMGRCVTNLSVCSYGDYMCSGSSRMNCTRTSDGFWKYTNLETCEYTCLEWRNGTNYCKEITGTHGTANSIEYILNTLGFIFEGGLAIAYIGFSLIFSGYLHYKASGHGGPSKLGPIMFLALIVAGTLTSILPLWTGLSLGLLSIALVFIRSG